MVGKPPVRFCSELSTGGHVAEAKGQWASWGCTGGGLACSTEQPNMVEVCVCQCDPVGSCVLACTVRGFAAGQGLL